MSPQSLYVNLSADEVGISITINFSRCFKDGIREWQRNFSRADIADRALNRPDIYERGDLRRPKPVPLAANKDHTFRGRSTLSITVTGRGQYCATDTRFLKRYISTKQTFHHYRCDGKKIGRISIGRQVGSQKRFRRLA